MFNVLRITKGYSAWQYFHKSLKYKADITCCLWISTCSKVQKQIHQTQESGHCQGGRQGFGYISNILLLTKKEGPNTNMAKR